MKMVRWVLLLLLLEATHLVSLTLGESKAVEVVGLMGSGHGGVEEEMESETSRRLMGSQQQRRYISYELLRADVVPCSRPGVLYYNCRVTTARVNPYHRGCGVISRCARYDDP